LLIAEPDVLSFDLADLKLKAPSFAILASDGLWDAFSNEEVRFICFFSSFNFVYCKN